MLTKNQNSEENDAVQLMTLHASKGLEFPVVFLCSLMEWSFPRREPLKEEHYPTPKKFKYKKHYSHFNEEFLKAYTNEEKRVLYVGLTRAKSTLIVSHGLHFAHQVASHLRYVYHSSHLYAQSLAISAGFEGSAKNL